MALTRVYGQAKKGSEREREKFNGLIGEYIRNRIRIRFLAIKWPA